MPAKSRLMITEAEQRFPVRVRVEQPAEGLGTRLDRMTPWLDDTCDAGLGDDTGRHARCDQ